MQRASKIKMYLSLLTPSATGIILYVFLAALNMVLDQFEMIKKVLQIPQNVEFTRMLASGADRLLSSAIGETRTETLVVGIFWAAVGLIVYVFLHGLSRIAVELDDDLVARRYIWPKGADRYAPLRVLEQQIIFRGAAIVGLIFVLFGPLAAVLHGPILKEFIGPSLIMQYVFWFLASVLTWHIVVILLRLITLRARLFG